MIESTNELSRNKRSSNAGNEKVTVLVLRWVFILIIIPVFFFTSENPSSKFVFFETLAIVIIYNVLVSMYFPDEGEKKKQLWRVIVFADIIAVAIFTYLMGGLSSDIYLVLFFIIGYYSFNNNAPHTIVVSIFCVIVYSITSILASEKNLEAFNFWRLVIRDFFIVIAAYGITYIIKEVKRYDELRKKEFKLARTDKLTGLANRHYLDQKLNDEVEYSNSTGKPLNVLIFDLDNFKKFNDTYGHIWGDKLLALFSDIIMQNIRKYDIPIRYGGEEFLLLIRDLDIETAKGVGDRIRRQLEKQRIYVGNDDNRKRVTVSCGVAQYPKHSMDIKEVIDLADKALYHAKETGKNIVVSYDEMGESCYIKENKA